MTTSPHPAPQKRGITAGAIVALVVLALALVFVFSNLDEGPVHFLWITVTMPVWIWFLLVLLAGVIVGSLFPWFRPRKKNRQ